MAWLSGYAYRKEITINNGGAGTLTNYQLLLNIVKGSGSDSGSTVYLASHNLDWPEDIRFTKSDGTTLIDFWREESDATDGTWWIEFDSLPVGNSTFYIYYGKASDSDVSSGANTFIVFDDFERGVNDDTIGGDWTELFAHVHISTDHAYGGTRCAKLVGAANGPIANIPVTATDNIAIRYRLWKEDAAAGFYLHIANGTWICYPRINVTEDFHWYDGAAFVDTGDNITPDQWELIEYRNFVWATPVCDFVLNGTIIQAAADISYAFSDANYDNKVRMVLENDAAGRDAYIDNFIVRNWTATEPTWSAWGSEETGLYTQVVTDSLTLIDSSLKYSKRSFIDVLTLVDTASAFRLVTQLVTDTLEIIDSSSIYAKKLITDAVSLVDSTVKSAMRVLSNALTVTDIIELTPTTQNLTVTGEGADTSGAYAGTPANYTGMNLDDGNTSYLNYTTPSYHCFTFDPFTQAGTINSVTLWVSVSRLDPTLYCRYDSTRDTQTPSGSWDGSWWEGSYTWNTDPAGGAWAAANLNARQFGMYYSPITNIYWTYTYLVVNYTPTSPSVIKRVGKTISDSVELVDSYIQRAGKVITDSLEIIDSTPIQRIGRSITDAITVTDSMLKSVYLILSDSLSATDSVLKWIGKEISDAWEIIDSTIVQKGWSVICEETLEITDELNKYVQSVRSDVVELTDSLNKYIQTTIAEVITFWDTSFDYIKVTIGDSLAITDSVSKYVRRIFSEVVSLVESIIATYFPKGELKLYSTLKTGIALLSTMKLSADLFSTLKDNVTSVSTMKDNVNMESTMKDNVDMKSNMEGGGE